MSVLRRLLGLPTGDGVLGHVCHSYFKLEWQQRGQLHVHVVLWLENPGAADSLVTAELPRTHGPDPWMRLLRAYLLANNVHRCISSRCMRGLFGSTLHACKYEAP